MSSQYEQAQNIIATIADTKRALTEMLDRIALTPRFQYLGVHVAALASCKEDIAMAIDEMTFDARTDAQHIINEQEIAELRRHQRQESTYSVGGNYA